VNATDTREGSEITVYDGFSVEYRDASHRYWTITGAGGTAGHERTPAISVTSALKVLDKPALVAWAERMGVEGALRLERSGVLADINEEDALGVVRAHGEGAEAKREAGADRGTAIHEALRVYCSEGKVPNVGDFDPHVRGYVQGLCKWLLQAQPEPILSEQVVASPTHGFAGRLDLLATVDGRRKLVDLKTNPAGRVYMEAHLQTAAYVLAAYECGLDPVDDAVIVAAGEDGGFQAMPCCSDPSHFLAVLACHKAVSAVRSSIRAVEKAA
jgi:hypothetical protein